MPHHPPVALAIAGSDSGGGAGIQADLRTFAAYGVHGTTAIAALTAQHTRGVTAVHVPPVAFLRAQLDAVFEDFPVAVVKIGMLADAAIIEATADALEAWPGVPVVLDPVMVASSGARLLAEDAVAALVARLLPRATVVTPNAPEAEVLAGRPLAATAQLREVAEALRALGARAVLLKGGHLPGDEVRDLLLTESGETGWSHPRLDAEGHGTGCTLASAVAAGLALGRPLAEAAADAADYVHGALRHGYRPGRGAVTVLDHLWRLHASSPGAR